jgi:hypothetical protein
MQRSRNVKSLRLATSALCLVGAAVAWSHSGPHAPKPVQPPAVSPGSFGKGDPAPNRFDSETGLSSGGIGYSWTVSALGNLSAELSGIVGASSWRDAQSSDPGEGATRASSWVALRLRSSSLVTIRLQRASGIPDPLGLLPGETGGEILQPAFTVYSGWQESGADETSYPTQGGIPWADALEYVSHAEDEGDGMVEMSLELPAGDYSVALGGIGGPGFDAGRQGYEADISILSRALPASILTKGSRFSSKKKSFRLKGRFRNPDSAAFLAFQQNAKTRFFAARGSAWSVTVKGLKPGVNYVYLTAVSYDGRTSLRKKITITRK